MKTKKAQVDSFLAQPHIAVAGYSGNPKKFGNIVFSTLKEKGYNLYPVNPSGGKTPDGETIYENLETLPDDAHPANRHPPLPLVAGQDFWETAGMISIFYQFLPSVSHDL